MKLSDELQKSGIVSEALDEAVHQTAGRLATDVNNQGLDAQVDYLLATDWDEDDIRRWIKPKTESIIGYLIGDVLIDPVSELPEAPRRARLTWKYPDPAPVVGSVVPGYVCVEELS